MSPAIKKSVASKDPKKTAAPKKKAIKKKTAKKKAVKKKVVKKTVAKTEPSKKKITKKKVIKKSTSLDITPEERWKMVAIAAYHKAEKRGFAPGNELQDWTESEKEIDLLLHG
jgi:hypothetical protein